MRTSMLSREDGAFLRIDMQPIKMCKVPSHHPCRQDGGECCVRTADMLCQTTWDRYTARQHDVNVARDHHVPSSHVLKTGPYVSTHNLLTPDGVAVWHDDVGSEQKNRQRYVERGVFPGVFRAKNPRRQSRRLCKLPLHQTTTCRTTRPPPCLHRRR